MQMKIQSIANLIEEYAPYSTGVPGDKLGLLAGDPDADAAGVVTCWSPTLAVLDEAARLGANMVISHEPLTWRVCGRDPEANLEWYSERHPTAKIPNQKRMQFIFAHGLSVYRYHSNWDWAPNYGMVDMLAKRLDLGTTVEGEAFAPVYVIPPTTARDLLLQARKNLQTGPFRVVGDPERVVTRVAICQGGFGQMFTFAEVALRGGAKLAFFGEMLDYTIRYCVATNLSVIELGHYTSEDPGMLGMCEFLRERLPHDIPVTHVHSGEPWDYLPQEYPLGTGESK